MKSKLNRRKIMPISILSIKQSAVRLPNGYETSSERWFLANYYLDDANKCNIINLRYYKQNKFAVLIDTDCLSVEFVKIVFNRISEIGILIKGYLFISKQSPRIKIWTLSAHEYNFEMILMSNLFVRERVFNKLIKKTKKLLKNEKEIDMVYLVIGNKDYMRYYDTLVNYRDRMVIFDINQINRKEV